MTVRKIKFCSRFEDILICSGGDVQTDGRIAGKWRSHSAQGSGIEVRIFRWAGEARPSENPYKFRTTPPRK